MIFPDSKNGKIGAILPNRLQPGRTLMVFFPSKDSTLQILLLSAVTGIITGIFCSTLRLSIVYINRIRELWIASGDNTGLTSDISKVVVVVISSALLSLLAAYLVFRLAPEAKGSGIPEVEGAIENVHPIRWWRIIPVKLLGGTCAMSSGLVLGRGGPSVQIGASSGQMIHDLFRLKEKDSLHTLMVCGTAAGMAVAFNAPLSGILFVMTEEMLPNLHYTFRSFKAVIMATITATITDQLLVGSQLLLEVPGLSHAPLSATPAFIFVGMVSGVAGVMFNHLIIISRRLFVLFHNNNPKPYLSVVTLLGAMFGLLLLFFPDLARDGSAVIIDIARQQFSAVMLALLFFCRFIATLLCFGSGAPGGMMMPTLALGSLSGAAMGTAYIHLFPQTPLELNLFCLTGMGALFASTVRAPVTAIVLVMETTGNHNLLLPLLISTLSAVMVAHAMGGRPIDRWLLQQSLMLKQAISDKK